MCARASSLRVCAFCQQFLRSGHGTTDKVEWEEEQAAWVEWERKISLNGAPKGTARPALAYSSSSSSSGSSGKGSRDYRSSNRLSSHRSNGVEKKNDDDDEGDDAATSLTHELKQENAILTERCAGLMKYHGHVHKRLKEVCVSAFCLISSAFNLSPARMSLLLPP